MSAYNYIRYQVKGAYGEVYLNRPDKRNAFHEAMIKELLAAMDEAEKEPELKALVFRGAGKVFSAGADLQWMQQVVDYSFQENLRESENLAALFKRLYYSPLTIISMVHGACIGGANGIVGASDVVVASPETTFKFSEVKLGLVPATIAPYVLKRMPLPQVRYFMLSGLPFNGQEAAEMGFVNVALKAAFFDGELEKIMNSIRENGRGAMQQTKRLLTRIEGRKPTEVEEDTVAVIANARVSGEAQQRMKRFFKK